MATDSIASGSTGRPSCDFDYIGKLRNVINEREAPAFPRDAEFAKLVDLPSCFERRLNALARQDMLNRMIAEAGPQSTAIDFANAVQAIECCTGGIDSGFRNWSMAVRLAGILFEARGASTEQVNQWIEKFTPASLPPEFDDEPADAPFGDSVRLAAISSNAFATCDWWHHDATTGRKILVSVGSAPLDSKGRRLLKDSHAQRDENVRTLRLMGLFAVIVIAFAIAFRVAPATGDPVLAQTVLCILLMLAVSGLAIRFFRDRPFDSMGGVVPILYLIWLLFAFAAVLA